MRRIVDQSDYDDTKSVPNSSVVQRRPSKVRACLLGFSVTFGALQLACGIVLGTVEAILTFIPKSVSQHLQFPLPVYVCAIMALLSGLSCIVGVKVANSYLLLGGIFTSMSACIVSLANMLSVVMTTLPLFSSFRHYRYIPEEESCVACNERDVQMNGECSGSVFDGVSSCATIEFTMPPVTVLLLIVYAAACLVSFLSTGLHSIALCSKQKQKNDKFAYQNERERTHDEIRYDANSRNFHSSRFESNLASFDESPHNSHMHGSPAVSWTHLPTHRPISCGFVDQNPGPTYKLPRAATLSGLTMYDKNHATRRQSRYSLHDNKECISGPSSARKHDARGSDCSQDWVNLGRLPLARSPSAQVYNGRNGVSKPPPYSILQFAGTEADFNEEEETSF